MTIIQANLKHLYQRKGFWVVDVFLVIFNVLGVALAIEGEATFTMVFLCFMCVAGLFVGAMQVEVLARPFSYCLPGHERVPVRLLFCFGLISALVWSLLSLLYPAEGWDKGILVVSVFFASTIAYWIGIWGVFGHQNWGAAIGLGMLIFMFGSFLDGERVLRYVLLDGWPFVAAGGCAANIAAWRFLSRGGLARRYCGQMWLGAFDPWNKERMAKFSQARIAQQKAFGVRPGVERFFLRRIRGGRGMAPYVWGHLYTAGGVITASRTKDWISWVLMGLAFTGYFAYIGSVLDVMFVAPGLAVMDMCLGVRSSLPAYAGRRERFWSALAVAGVAAVVTVSAAAAIAGLTMLLQPVMPVLTRHGQDFVFRAMDMRFIVLPMTMIPVMLTVSLIFYRYRRLTVAVVAGSFMIILQLLSERWTGVLTIQTIMTAGAVVAGCWALFTAVSRYVCMRCCLVR
jgi:hypothetical protein